MCARILPHWTFSMALIALLLSGYTGIQAQPRAGDWHCPVDFGEIVLTVNTEGTLIPQLVLELAGYSCGGVGATVSGTNTWSTSPGWPITDNKFTMTLPPGSFPTQIRWTISGTFTDSGEEVSGTWSVDFYGAACSGNFGASVVSIEQEGEIPDRFALAQNYPNPFNPGTTIEFAVPRAADVSIKIYNSLGVEVATLIDGHLRAGQYEATWDATGLPSDLYLAKMMAGEFVATRKLILLK